MIDIPGLSPTRVVEDKGDHVVIHIKPPSIISDQTEKVILTREQYKRYQNWRSGRVLIQNALGDLSADDRERLMSGLGPEKFHEIAKEENEC